MMHVAYNIDTDEIITSNHSNHLKRLVKQNNKWNREHELPTGRWLFAHNKQGVERIRRQIDARTI